MALKMGSFGKMAQWGGGGGREDAEIAEKARSGNGENTWCACWASYRSGGGASWAFAPPRVGDVGFLLGKVRLDFFIFRSRGAERVGTECVSGVSLRGGRRGGGGMTLGRTSRAWSISVWVV